MSCNLSEEELWSDLDRGAPGLAEHLATCAMCRTRAAEFRSGIRALTRVSTPTTAPLPAHIGSYRIHRRLGEGGMGLVYEGEQQSPARRVAIKVVRGGQCGDEYLVRLFQREVQALARLKHPAIASIFEAGRTEDGQHFFVMELVPGVPLTEYVRDHRLALSGRLALFRKICDAIHYAHQRGVIHRDLKPTNILVDAQGHPKVLDFGLARITDPDVDLAGAVTVLGRMGTPAYMSPEEARGRRDEIDVRTDVYSLGVILYELLTAALPYSVRKADWHETVRVICEESPRRSPLRRRVLRGDLETLVLKALAKDPARRYQSAAMIADDIDRYLTNQPIYARRASTLYRFRKLVARHVVFFAFTGFLFVVFAGATYWGRWVHAQAQTVTRVSEELADLKVAIKAQALAAEYLTDGKYDKAESEYREALATYDRLERYKPRRAGETLLALGTLLSTRPQAPEADYEEAEEFLLDAGAIFEEGGPEWRSKLRASRLALRAALEALHAVLEHRYETDELDDPETVRALDERLDGIELELDALARLLD